MESFKEWKEQQLRDAPLDEKCGNLRVVEQLLQLYCRYSLVLLY